MEFTNTRLSQEHSVFNDVFCQLHQSNLFLQELTQNLVKEQVRMAEMMTRVQVDLKAHKESQNDRLDEMMHNIDTDVKKVHNDLRKDCEKVLTEIFEIKNEYVEVKYYNQMKADLEEMKQVVKFKAANHKIENESILLDKVENMRKELTSFKTDIEKVVVENYLDYLKVKDSIEESCIQKLEEYIGTEILEEIDSTINLKLNSLKADFQDGLEEMIIQLGEIDSVCVNLKHKITEIENPKKSFDESDLYLSDFEELGTPMRMPITEWFYNNKNIRSRSNPKSQDITDEPSTLNELVINTSEETEDDEEESMESDQTPRQESWMSSVMINLASFTDVVW